MPVWAGKCQKLDKARETRKAKLECWCLKWKYSGLCAYVERKKRTGLWKAAFFFPSVLHKPQQSEVYLQWVLHLTLPKSASPWFLLHVTLLGESTYSTSKWADVFIYGWCPRFRSQAMLFLIATRIGIYAWIRFVGCGFDTAFFQRDVCLPLSICMLPGYIKCNVLLRKPVLNIWTLVKQSNRTVPMVQCVQ